MNKEELKKDLEMAKKYLSVAERAMIAATASWDSVTRVMNTAQSLFKEADEAFRKNRTPKLEEDLKEAHNTLRIAQDLWTAARAWQRAIGHFLDTAKTTHEKAEGAFKEGAAK